MTAPGGMEGSFTAAELALNLTMEGSRHALTDESGKKEFCAVQYWGEAASLSCKEVRKELKVV